MNGICSGCEFPIRHISLMSSELSTSDFCQKTLTLCNRDKAIISIIWHKPTTFILLCQTPLEHGGGFVTMTNSSVKVRVLCQEGGVWGGQLVSDWSIIQDGNSACDWTRIQDGKWKSSHLIGQ